MSDNHLNNTLGVTTAALAAYAQTEEYVNGPYHRTVIHLEAYPLATTDNDTDGASGAASLYTFPKGYIRVLGGIQKWTTVSADGTGLTTSAALEIAVGTTAVDTVTLNALTGADADVITVKGFTLSAADGTNITGPATYTAMKVIDGTSSAAVIYLNAGASAATSTAAGVLTLSGDLVIDWMDYGYAGD